MLQPGTTYQRLESFWEAIANSVRDRNHPTFHPCCGIWTGRFQTVLRRSHSVSMAWGQIIPKRHAMLTPVPDLLRAHMLEQGWGPPIRFNFKCALAISEPRRTPQMGIPRVFCEQKPLKRGAFLRHQAQLTLTYPNSNDSHLSEQSPQQTSLQIAPPQVPVSPSIESDYRLHSIG